MTAKTLTPWACVIVLAAATAMLYSANTKKDAELARLRPQAKQVEDLRTELETAKSTVASQTAELTRLQKDSEDVLRLRNEVRQLRDQSQQMAKQVQTAQHASENAQQRAEQLQSQNQQLQTAARQSDAIAQRNACINNLRQIDAAEQQWALENSKPATAVPTAQDLMPYFKDHKIPTCPAGGHYVIRAVSQPPTCTIPGHVLPQLPQ